MVAVLSWECATTIFPVTVLNWKVIYFFRFLVVNSVICTAVWPKPAFQFVLLIRHISGTFSHFVWQTSLVRTGAEQRVNTIFLAYWLPNISGYKHEVNCKLFSISLIAFVMLFKWCQQELHQLAFFDHSDCNCLSLETKESITVRIFFFFKWSTRGR